MPRHPSKKLFEELGLRRPRSRVTLLRQLPLFVLGHSGCNKDGQDKSASPLQLLLHVQKSLGSYALLAIAREPFELCPRFKSLSSVSRRELSIDLRWRASRPKPEFPAPEIETERRCAQGERGVNKV